MNRPASRARAFSDDDSRVPPPDDWVSLAIACAACLALVAMVYAMVMAWPLL